MDGQTLLTPGQKKALRDKKGAPPKAQKRRIKKAEKALLPTRVFSIREIFIMIMKNLLICDQMSFNFVRKEWYIPLEFARDSVKLSLFTVIKYDCIPGMEHGCRKCNSTRYFSKSCDASCFQNDPILFNPLTHESCLFLSETYQKQKNDFSTKKYVFDNDIRAVILSNIIFCLCGKVK